MNAASVPNETRCVSENLVLTRLPRRPITRLPRQRSPGGVVVRSARGRVRALSSRAMWDDARHQRRRGRCRRKTSSRGQDVRARSGIVRLVRSRQGQNAAAHANICERRDLRDSRKIRRSAEIRGSSRSCRIRPTSRGDAISRSASTQRGCRAGDPRLSSSREQQCSGPCPRI
jgi:hypothetical protein